MSGNHDNLSDADLVRRICGGQRDLCAALVDRHLRSVYAVALRITGNPADAEDVAQDTFVRAFERLGQYDERYLFRNWILKIATNLAIGDLRSRRRREQFHGRFAKVYPSKEAAGDPGGDGQAECCRQLLDHLDDDQRTALVLFHFQELPYAEVAQVMNVPVNTVRTLIHRGRARLRELMTRKNSVAEKGDMENKVWIVER